VLIAKLLTSCQIAHSEEVVNTEEPWQHEKVHTAQRSLAVRQSVRRVWDMGPHTLQLFSSANSMACTHTHDRFVPASTSDVGELLNLARWESQGCDHLRQICFSLELLGEMERSFPLCLSWDCSNEKLANKPSLPECSESKLQIWFPRLSTGTEASAPGKI
jgi:hypothetical protein